MNRNEHRRLGLAWGASLALSAVAGALAAWALGGPRSGAGAGAAIPIAAAAVAALAASLAVRSWRRLAAPASVAPMAPVAAEAADENIGAACAELLGPAAPAADTRPVVWSETLDAGSAAKGEPAADAALPPASAMGGPVADRGMSPDDGPAGAEVPPDGSSVGPVGRDGAPAPAGPGGASPVAATLQDALRRALQAGELRLIYQPVFDLEARHVHAVEALLRWPRAAQALLPTEDIVAIADRGGFCADLGRFVLAGASQQIRRWQQVLGAAAPGRVNINLSRRQCLADSLLDDFERTLALHGLDAGHFQFELAERDVAADIDVEARLHELRALGATVALDHFGLANSSLAGLQRLPIDAIKVDRSLLRRAQAGSTVRVVLQSTLGLAAELGLEVVVEGVETTEQLALLRSLGCRLAQGHALCPPADPFALTRRLRGGHWLTEAARDDPARTASEG